MHGTQADGLTEGLATDVVKVLFPFQYVHHKNNAKKCIYITRPAALHIT